jgi:isopentenyl-diphosphate delta-isomerase
MKNDQVILVSEDNTPRGIMEKLEAHQKAELHRAFSIFIFNSKGEMLLQKRALSKYHSGGRWTNTCCGHPQPGMDLETCAHARLNEEMGFDCTFKNAFDLTYKAELDNGLTEHEYDHVFLGYYDGLPKSNPLEVSHWKYQNTTRLQEDVKRNPDNYTAWFKIILPQLLNHIQTKKTI